jgi:uncharacterized protein YndB with AHSA1/START domain
MTHPANAAQASIKFDRRYEDTDLEDLWDLWTTKAGFESWWGPEGFRVEVHKLDLRTGGELVYDMIADAPEQIAAMKSMNMPLSHGTRGNFGTIDRLKRLSITHIIDFVPGVKPYTNRIDVEFLKEGSAARMVIQVEAHHTAQWTKMAQAGMESQLTKVPKVLAARH